MKYITFRELLNLIYDNKAPELIKYKGTSRNYQRELINYIDFNGVHKSGVAYIDFEGNHISSVIGGDLLLCQMTDGECIIILDGILTIVEKEYLSNLIKPFKESVKYIAKVETEGRERIQLCYKDYLDKSDSDFMRNHTFVGLPTFKAGTMYCGMELDRQYTVEELGL